MPWEAGCVKVTLQDGTVKDLSTSKVRLPRTEPVMRLRFYRGATPRELPNLSRQMLALADRINNVTGIKLTKAADDVKAQESAAVLKRQTSSELSSALEKLEKRLARLQVRAPER